MWRALNLRSCPALRWHWQEEVVVSSGQWNIVWRQRSRRRRYKLVVDVLRVRNNITSPTRQRSADVFMEEDNESRGSSSTTTRLVLSNLPSHEPKVLLNKFRILRTGWDLWFDNPPRKRENQKQPISLCITFLTWENWRVQLESTTKSVNLINKTLFIYRDYGFNLSKNTVWVILNIKHQWLTTQFKNLLKILRIRFLPSWRPESSRLGKGTNCGKSVSHTINCNNAAKLFAICFLKQVICTSKQRNCWWKVCLGIVEITYNWALSWKC